jgi:hypothetical protein
MPDDFWTDARRAATEVATWPWWKRGAEAPPEALAWSLDLGPAPDLPEHTAREEHPGWVVVRDAAGSVVAEMPRATFERLRGVGTAG